MTLLKNSRRVKGSKTQRAFCKVLRVRDLANRKEAITATPPTAPVVQAKLAIVITAPEFRDVTIAIELANRT